MHGGAGGLRRYRLRGAAQAFHPVDVQGEVLTAGGHDLVVEQGVAVDVGEVGGDQVVLVERRQNADHHDPRVELSRLSVRIGQRGAYFLGEPVEYTPSQRMWSYVDFQVEHGEFCLEISARDAFEHLRIQHFRHAVGAGEIQFDLQPHEVLRPIEPLLLQQPLQARQALPELAAVALAIGQIEPTCHDLLPHRSVPPRMGVPYIGRRASRVRWDDAQRSRSITSRTDPATATLAQVTGGTFTGHAALCSFECPEHLVKNADDNWPSSSPAFFEVIAVRPIQNRDDSHVSPTEWTLAERLGNG